MENLSELIKNIENYSLGNPGEHKDLVGYAEELYEKEDSLIKRMGTVCKEFVKETGNYDLSEDIIRKAFSKIGIKRSSRICSKNMIIGALFSGVISKTCATAYYDGIKEGYETARNGLKIILELEETTKDAKRIVEAAMNTGL